jgi:multiple sugar transport system permease protein
MWQDHFFRTSVWITIQYTFWSVWLKLVLGLAAALLLHRLKRFAAVITGLALLPWIIPEVVRAITWKGLLDPLYGMVNRLLLDLGLIERPIAFFGDVDTALPSVILVSVWAGIPFFTIVLLAGLKAIDKELYEAAAIDGASAWRQFLHITLPGLRPVIIVGALLSTIWGLNDFTPIFVLTRGGPVGSTLVYPIRVYEAAQNFRFGVGAAMGVTLTPVLGIFILTLSRYMIIGGRTSEAVQNDNAGLGMQVLSVLAWPFRLCLSLLTAVFWLINDLVERLVEQVGGLSRPALKATQYAQVWLTWVALAILLIFLLGPFYWVTITSFKTELQITTLTRVLWPQPWTLDQYLILLGPTRNFATWFMNSFFVSLVAPLISTLVGALGAYGLTRLRWRGRNAFSSFVLIAYMTPGVLLLIPLELILSAFDLIGSVWSLVIAYPTFTLPFALWMMMGYYASIPEELEAAALIDGCNRFQVFVRIVLPLTSPALLAIFLFGMTHAWGEFLFASRFFGNTLPVVLARLVYSGVAPWGELTAASVLMTIPVLIIYVLGQKFMVEGLAAGAIKGGA